ncbi:MAG TPA: hypothetical protein VMM77_05565 [Gemmatimonadaceae bacterium]|nr:hypothetical protein [Gemmatimonadaceae bacterium]
MATALGGLVIIGVMIAGVFFTSNQELRVGTNIFVQERAFRAAEFGINASLASWKNSEMLLLPIGGTKEIVYDSSSQGWRDTVTITRLNATGYLIGSTGTAFGGIQGSSRRRTALLVRISVPSLSTKAAVTAGGDVQLTSEPIVGLDTSPLAWLDCPLPEDSVAAVVVPDSSDVLFTRKDCPLDVCLVGSPKLLATPAATDLTTYNDFVDETFSGLTSLGAKVFNSSSSIPNSFGPVVTDGSCNTTALKNLGDPARGNPAGACESYFPIIHSEGAGYTLTLRGGSGQGILLVDGDLEIAGDFQFYGPVIVKGKFAGKNSAKIHGALMVANSAGGANTFANTSTVTYSSCAIKKAFANAIPPKRVVERAWMEAF